MERKVWEALVAGDAKADEALLSEDFTGVYKSGFADRAGHAAQLANGPVISSYKITDPRLISLGDDIALLVYLAQYTRPSAPDQREAMYVSSIWRRTGDGWANIFSQDTDVAEAR
jgi:hypothetical protein